MLSRVQHYALPAALLLAALAIPRWSFAEDAVEAKAQVAAPQSADSAAVALPSSPEEAALRAIQEEGRRQVETLVLRMEGLAQGPALRELQASVTRVKRDTLVRFLTARAQFDRTRGDEAAALQADKLIEQILHPAAPPASNVPQPRDKSVEQKGGRS